MEMIQAALAVLLGYLLGSIPFGYVVVRVIRGIDVRDYGSHNIGATNVLRVVGPIPALITLFGDIAKGTLPVLFAADLIASGPARAWIIVAAALAAIVGHAYSLYFYLRERRFSRGKAVAAGLGAMIGFVLVGATPHAGLWIPLAVWLVVLVLPRLFRSRWGYVSLASILAALSVAPVYLLLGVDTAYVVFALLVAVFVLWKHKENIGRLLDGTEVRLGEKPPLASVDADRSEIACAFMIHPMAPSDWWQTWRFRWALPLYRIGVLSDGMIARAMLWTRPMKLDEIRGIEVSTGQRARVYLLGVPWLPDQIKEHPELAVKRAVQAARLAKELGASVLGLGAYWSVIGNKGADVQAQTEIAVTNGGAYTAGTVRLAVPTMLRRLAMRGISPEQARAAVVGANGVVGFGICRSILDAVATLVMVGTSQERLEKSAQALRRRHPGVEIVATTSLEPLRECDLIFTATSEPNAVVLPQHVRPGTLLYDLGRPPDVDERVKEIAGVEVVPGGTVRPPGRPSGRLNIYFGTGQIPACMAETLIIALDGAYERTSLGGEAKLENIEYFVRRAEELGFCIVEEGAPPATAGEPSPPGQRPESRDLAPMLLTEP
jgi:acyl-phosphate glycerol 3-phosphate acyltransferase